MRIPAQIWMLAFVKFIGRGLAGRRWVPRPRPSPSQVFICCLVPQERCRASDASTTSTTSTSCLRRCSRYLLVLLLTPGLRSKACVVFYLWAVSGASYNGLSHYARILR